MKKHNVGDRVEPGIYWSPRHLAFRSVEEAGPLPGVAGETAYAVPALALFVVGPLMGLVYVVFLPLLGFVLLGGLIVRQISTLPSRLRNRPRVEEQLEAWEAQRRSPEPGPPTPRTLITRSAVLPASLDAAYDGAHSPDSWADWHATGDTRTGRTHLRMNLPGPLGSEVLWEDHDQSQARWRSRCEIPVEVVTSKDTHVVAALSGEEDWWCYSEPEGTRVWVTLEVEMPPGLQEKALTRLGESALDQNLRHLSEICH